MKYDLSKVTHTPCYYYDMALLDATLAEINRLIKGHDMLVHYAIKANANPDILRRIAAAGLGADCVSGGEIRLALDCGFRPETICFAGVGKTDDELRLAIQAGIASINVESIEELDIIATIAATINNGPARVALRINPNIDAHTHHYITTGLEENKFGIDISLTDTAINRIVANPWLELTGLHFHIGSQIQTMEPYLILCGRVNKLTKRLEQRGIKVKTINLGGGLGVDYDNPDANPIPDFEELFSTAFRHLDLRPGQTVHFELGRSIVAQCGTLLTQVIYVKNGVNRRFAIVDAGMNDLIRPALYQARHHIDVLDGQGDTIADGPVKTYDVVGPVCESSDTFATDLPLPTLQRGTLLAIRSAGAYGQSMSSTYNQRPLAPAVLS